MVTFFIPGNTPSSKNSKQWTGKYLVSSKSTQRYIKESKEHWLKHAATFRAIYDRLEKPIRIGFKFLRNSHRRFDLINAAQCPLDLMVQYGWIEDDNADCVIPVFEPYSYNKEDSGVVIYVLE